jgi:hypothetical protein
MSRFFMPELSKGERLSILQNNADKIEQTTYLKPLTEDELNERREALTDNCIKLGDLEEEKANIVADLKAKMDPLKAVNKELLWELRVKQAKVDGTLFHMANHDDNMMETYDHNGELVSTRRLRPDEKQTRIPLNIAK